MFSKIKTFMGQLINLLQIFLENFVNNSNEFLKLTNTTIVIRTL